MKESTACLPRYLSQSSNGKKTGVTKRYACLTDDFLRENPNVLTYKAPSLDARQKFMIKELPMLAKEAASKAINEWDQPVSRITHLLFCSTSGGYHLPSSDLQLTKLLGLKPTVQRLLILTHGCFAAGTALRLAKDIAENNAGSRVLIVCSEVLASCFHAPSEDALGMLAGSSIFGDGAAAVIIGADPDTGTERPWFELVKGSEVYLPDTEDCLRGVLGEMGWSYELSKRLPQAIVDNILQILEGMLKWTGKSEDQNGLFYVIHPGGPAILNGIEEKLGLKKDKLECSRRVLRDYGNAWSPSVLFVLDEMRRKSVEEDKASTTGGGMELGLLLTFGPGLSLEIMVPRSIATKVY